VPTTQDYRVLSQKRWAGVKPLELTGLLPGGDSFLSLKMDFAKRSIEGYCATYTADEVGDRIEQGAFDDSLQERHFGPMQQYGRSDVRGLWQHDVNQPIARTDQAKADAVGYWIKGFISRTSRGEDALELLFDRAIDRMSIGYKVLLQKMVDALRLLQKVDVWEWSPVTFPANMAARVGDVVKAQPFAMGLEFKTMASGICIPKALGDMGSPVESTEIDDEATDLAEIVAGDEDDLLPVQELEPDPLPKPKKDKKKSDCSLANVEEEDMMTKAGKAIADRNRKRLLAMKEEIEAMLKEDGGDDEEEKAPGQSQPGVKPGGDYDPRTIDNPTQKAAKPKVKEPPVDEKGKKPANEDEDEQEDEDEDENDEEDDSDGDKAKKKKKKAHDGRFSIKGAAATAAIMDCPACDNKCVLTMHKSLSDYGGSQTMTCPQCSQGLVMDLGHAGTMTAADTKSHASSSLIDCPGCAKSHMATLKKKSMNTSYGYEQGGPKCPTCSQGMTTTLGHAIETSPETKGLKPPSGKNANVDFDLGELERAISFKASPSEPELEAKGNDLGDSLDALLKAI
jgi:HK97 family phage prohead protease